MRTLLKTQVMPERKLTDSETHMTYAIRAAAEALHGPQLEAAQEALDLKERQVDPDGRLSHACFDESLAVTDLNYVKEDTMLAAALKVGERIGMRLGAVLGLKIGQPEFDLTAAGLPFRTTDEAMKSLTVAMVQDTAADALVAALVATFGIGAVPPESEEITVLVPGPFPVEGGAAE